MFLRCRKKPNPTYKNSYNKFEEALSTDAILKTLNPYLDEKSRTSFLATQKMTNKQFNKIKKTDVQLHEEKLRIEIPILERRRNQLSSWANFLYRQNNVYPYRKEESPSLLFQNNINYQLQQTLGYIQPLDRNCCGDIPFLLCASTCLGVGCDCLMRLLTSSDFGIFFGIQNPYCFTLMVPLFLGSTVGSSLCLAYLFQKKALEKAIDFNTQALAANQEIQTIKSKMVSPTMKRD